MSDRELLETLRERIARDPKIVPAVLDAVRDGMAAWQASVERHLDRAADQAISAALGLPRHHGDSSWSLADRGQRSLARLVAVGWGLVRRKPSCKLEADLVRFVQEADALDSEDAAGHYEILGSPPVPR